MTTIDDVWTGPSASHQVAGLACLSMELLPDDGSAAIQGVDGGSGAWTMRGVPPGGYTLRAVLVGGNHLVHHGDSDVMDLGRDLGETFDSPASGGTIADLSLAGLQAWDAADRIQLYSPRAGVWDQIDPALQAGATSGAASYDWSTWWQGPLQATDTLYALQVRGQPVGAAGDVAEGAVAAAAVTGVAMADGALNHLGLSLAPPAASGTLRARWSTSAFDRAVPGDHPTPSYGLSVTARPWPASVEPKQGLVLLKIMGPAGVLLPDRDDGDVQYGRVAPAGWTEYLQASFTSTQTRTTPGTSVTATLAAGATLQVPIGAVPDPIAPAVSAAQAITVGGKDAAVLQTGVGLEPVLAWAAPANGVPTSTRVTIRKLGTSSIVQPRAVAQFVTTGASVQVPPGILLAGGAYVATVTTVASPADRPSTAPWRSGMPRSQATVVTQVFTP